MKVLTDPACSGLDGLALYNGFDTQVTLAVAHAIKLTPAQERVYRAEMALQAPAMACGIRGVLVDEAMRKPTEAELTRLMEAEAAGVQGALAAQLGWGPSWSGLEFSSKDLKDAFFGPKRPATCEACGGTGVINTGVLYKTGPRAGAEKTKLCKLPHERRGLALKPTKTSKSGEPSLDKEALEKLILREGEASLVGTVCKSVSEVRYLAKQRELCRARLRAGRFHFSLNVGATVTYRFSSDADCMRYGGNSQNLHRVLRAMFVPDPGYVFVAFDLPAAESHLLAVITGDPLYLEAHEVGDSHTYVCRLAWPHLPWTGDIKADKKLADTWNFAEMMHLGITSPNTVRDIGKKLNHGAGRWGTERTFGRVAKLPLETARDILHNRFWATFHVARDWILAEQRRFQADPQVVIEGLGLPRRFFGRAWDVGTFRDLLAFRLQAPIVWATHTAFWRLWHYLDDKDLRPGHGRLQVLKHDHDSVTVQVREDCVDELLPEIKRLATVTIPCGAGRTLTLPPGLKVGKNLKEVK